MSNSGDSDLYVASRRALLDALDVLAPHSEALVLVGAHAIYHYTGEADVALATRTKDSDVAIDPRALLDDPLLEEAMRRGEFVLDPTSGQPGQWIKADGAIDLLVPESLGGGRGKRGARIDPHDRRAARNVKGLEAALVDKRRDQIRSLDPGDQRSAALWIAGPSALLVTKLHKLGDRHAAGGSRLEDKDAHDVYRLMRAVPLGEFEVGFRRLLGDEVSRAVSEEALECLTVLFASERSGGAIMAGRVEEGIGQPAVVAAASAALAREIHAVTTHAVTRP